uniref:Uncharacterized protein n=1 Tax=Strix occidentalis caurina TaxID=311401 RepID=A0A8D0EYR0_STROC
MASAKKGAEKWLSAITEKYTNTDHKWNHGVRAKCSYRSFVNLQRGTRSEICISTSLDKTVEVNGPFLTMSTCIWPENTRQRLARKKTKQNKKNPKTEHPHPHPQKKKTTHHKKKPKTQPPKPHLHRLYICVPVAMF